MRWAASSRDIDARRPVIATSVPSRPGLSSLSGMEQAGSRPPHPLCRSGAPRSRVGAELSGLPLLAGVDEELQEDRRAQAAVDGALEVADLAVEAGLDPHGLLVERQEGLGAPQPGAEAVDARGVGRAEAAADAAGVLQAVAEVRGDHEAAHVRSLELVAQDQAQQRAPLLDLGPG